MLQVCFAALALLSAALPAGADTIDDYAARQMQQLRLPGLALAVVRDGAVVAVRTYGSANLELGTPVTRDTVFELGSLTKQFTAAAVMLLVEDGRLRLDDGITTHLREVPAAWRAITVRHLLTHSSGLRDYLTVPGLPEQAHSLPHREMTALFAQRVPLEFLPGETWAYSNTGYLLLGDIVERVAGESYWDFLRARIFARAEMHLTGSSEPRTVIRGRAAGYGWSDGAFGNRPSLSEHAYSAGAIVSTIADMAKWAIALQAGGLVSAASRDAIWTPLRVARESASPVSYGFGWVVDRERGRRAVLHGGGTPGFSSAIRHYPDERVTVIVLTNHGDRILDHMPLEIAGMIFPDVARRDGSDPDPRRTIRLTQVLRLVMAGTPDLREFTPAMRLFLTTANGRGLGEWFASHGALKALTYVQAEPAGAHQLLRYRAILGDTELCFSFMVAADNTVAQISWW
jgi:CubicO group peptidase (beta-lactamase class C family)